MNKGINYKSVNVPRDFLLFSLERRSGNTKFESDFFAMDADKNNLKLQGELDDFYPEIYLEIVLKVKTLSSLMRKETVLIEGKSNDYGSWKLYLDRYGYLKFSGISQSSTLSTASPLSLTSFVDNVFRVGIAMNNYAFISRKTKHWNEAVGYNQLLLLASSSEDIGMEILSTTKAFPYPLLSPLQEQIEVPLIKEEDGDIDIIQISAYNSARYELFQKDNRELATNLVESNLSGASKVFPVYHQDRDRLDLYAGPEFCNSNSYWLFTKIKNVVKDKTMLRIHLSIGGGVPNMTPVFFWSEDRRNWFRTRTIRATDEKGVFYPLLLAPAKDFYLASSIPFLEQELDETIGKVESLPFVMTEDIGKTVEGRSIKLLKITDPDADDLNKKRIAMIVGQHSPLEMLGSHFLMPMIDYLKRHPEFLKKAVVYFVPIVNVDCAHWGGRGMNANKLNTNRCWIENLQPETISIRNYFGSQKEEGVNIDLFLDIHGGGTWRNHTILRYPNAYLKEAFPETAENIIQKTNRLLELFERHAGLRIIDSIELGFRNCSARDYFRLAYPEAVTFDLELSTSSYFDPIEKETKVVDQNSLNIVGAGLIKAISSYFLDSVQHSKKLVTET